MSEHTASEPGVVRAAPEVAALAARHADQAERDRMMHPDVVKAVVAAGFARHFVPTSHGGDAGTFAALGSALATIGARCPATAWCASIIANLARMAAYLPDQGRAEIWRDGPDTVVVGAVSPKGAAVPEREGWRLSGSWSYISAVDHSDWALVLAMTDVDDVREPRLFAVARPDYRIEATWSDIGMKATGSNTLIVDDVFVPAWRSVRAKELLDGEAPDAAATCHSVPLPAVNGLSFCLPMLGAAEGALQHWSVYAEQRIQAATTAPGPGPGRAFYEETLARSSGEIEAARLLLDRVAAVADRGEVTALETARNQRDCALVAELSVTAVDRIFRASGTGGHSESSPLQRWWRDVHSAAGHVVLQFGPAAASYAARALGV